MSDETVVRNRLSEAREGEGYLVGSEEAAVEDDKGDVESYA